jgi:hypothetical protein
MVNNLKEKAMSRFNLKPSRDNGIPLGSFDCDPETHNFHKQTDNYQRIKAILAQFDLKLARVVGSTYEGSPAYNSWSDHHVRLTTFNATTAELAPNGKPLFRWEKYEGGTAGGGQNHVYIAGEKMKLTAFLAGAVDHFKIALALTVTQKDLECMAK